MEAAPGAKVVPCPRKIARHRKRRHAIRRAKERLGVRLSMADLHAIENSVLAMDDEELWACRAPGMAIKVVVKMPRATFTAIYDLAYNCVVTVY